MTGAIQKNQLDALERISTATITMVLVKAGIRQSWVRGAFPLTANLNRVAGPAFTLRFIPMREDKATVESLSAPVNSRTAIEEMPEGSIAVIDAMGSRHAAILGDILAARMQAIGVRGVVTDGVVRDVEGVRDTGLAIWCAGVAAPPSISGLIFAGWQEAVGCGGTAIYPGDIIVADEDGAVVVPPELVARVVDEGSAQQDREDWILQRVKDGESLDGLYPPNEETLRRYDKWKRHNSRD